MSVTKKRRPAKAAKRAPARPSFKFPAIGTKMLGGIFAGIFHSRIDGVDYALIAGAATPDGASQPECVKWASGLSDGGFSDWKLWCRSSSSLLYGIATEDDRRGVFWSREQHAGHPGYAWYQDFYDGYQYYWLKGNSYRGRAVREVPIRSFIHSIISARGARR